MPKKNSSKFWLKADSAQLFSIKSLQPNEVVERSGRKRRIYHPIELDPSQVFFAIDMSEVWIDGFGTFGIYKTGNQPFKPNNKAGKTDLSVENGRVSLRIEFVSNQRRHPIPVIRVSTP
jgi:hypothetical protein